jgi:PKD domain
MAHVGGLLRVRGKLVVGVVALAALVALPAAPAAAAAWEPPQEISEAGTLTSGAQLGVDGAGDATAAWTASFTTGAIKSAYLPAGGTWQSVQTPISTTTCEKPSLAVSSSGAAVLVAACGAGKLRAAYRATATGSWGSVAELPGSENSAEPKAAIDSAGNAIVIWVHAETIESSYRPASTGIWGSAQKASAAGVTGSVPEARVAIAPNGTAIAIWPNLEAPTTYAIASISRSAGAGSTWGSLVKVPSTNVEALAPEIAVNAANTVIVWSQRGAPYSIEPFVLGSYWGKDASLHLAPETAGISAEDPSVAVDAQGRAISVWRGLEEGHSTGVVRSATAGEPLGAWSTPTTLPMPAGEVMALFAPGPQVAMDDAGDANAVWPVFNETGHSGSIYAASGSAAGPFAAAAPISNGNGAYLDKKTPTPIVEDHAGTAFAAWTAGTGERLTVAMRDGAPPILSGIVVPLSGDTAKPAAMSASASDVWSPPTTVHWDFGDGASGTGSSVSHAYSAPGTYTVKVSASDAQGNLSAAQERQIVVTGSGLETKKPQVVLHASVARQTWKAISRARAIKVKCGLDVSGSCAIAARLSAGTAKRLGLATKGARRLNIGSGSLSIPAQGTATVKVKLTKKALKAIGAARDDLSVALSATGSAPEHRDATVTKKLKIKRP